MALAARLARPARPRTRTRHEHDGATISAVQAQADTQRWLERAVIGLNLCPFAKAVHVRGQIHYAVYLPGDEAGLMDALLSEANELAACAASQRDTTLLIAPNTLAIFWTSTISRPAPSAVWRARDSRASSSWRASIRTISSPAREPEDITNATNRAPYPTLHLLREDSVSRAVEAFPAGRRHLRTQHRDAGSARRRRLGRAGRRRRAERPR